MSDDATVTLGQLPDERGSNEVAVRWMPDAIGPYRIIRLLGEGGMGAVYEAEQESPRRTVALKVVKPGLASPETLSRFQRESQALGRLQHPGIAQIYQAGTAETPFGRQPYFAMELIHGESLRKYADAHRLNTQQRLELTAKICEAVHHAHQRGLIHRDLKPGNVVVDETGQPKILDFGVARLTDRDAEATSQTDMGRLVGTVAYMSPEQVLADPLELDIRSDVYALGVILYELLAGRPPYKLSRNLPEAARTILEEDPAPLSSINRIWRGDIETIVSKALEKQKARRYSSAADLGADIRRYLKDEPIEARPASTGYQLAKFARRHKALVAGAAAVLVVLVAGIVASTLEAARAGRAERDAIQARDRALSAEQAATGERNRAVAAEAQAIEARNRAVSEKQRADTEAATAKAVNEFLQTDLLAQASANNQARPDTKPDPDLKVRTALDRAAAGIAGKFEKQPLVEASIRETIGSTYTDLGLYPEAQAQLELSVTLRTRVQGAEYPDTLAGVMQLANLYSLQNKYAQAEPLIVKTLEVRRRRLGEKDRKTADAMAALGLLDMRKGKYAEAEPLLSSSLDVRRRTLGAEHPSTLVAMSNLAALYYNQDKYTEAQTLFAGILAIKRRLLGAEHPDTLIGMNNLAAVYRKQGEYTQAEAILVDVLRINRRVLGEDHPETLRMMNNLGVVYVEQRKYAQAEELYTKVLLARRRVLGEEHSDTLSAMQNLGVSYLYQRMYQQAEPLLARALEVRRRVLGEEHPDTLHNANFLAALYLEQAAYGEAEHLLRPALIIYEKTAPDSWWRFHTQSQLGASLSGEKKYSEAESLLVAGYEGMLQRKASIPAGNRSDVESAGARLIQLYQDWGKPGKATEWSRKLQETGVASARQP